MGEIKTQHILDYLEIVEQEKVPVCREQKLLAQYIRKCFREEILSVNEEQLEKYLSYQKYFPFKLFPWERFIFALHNCVYTKDGELRWPHLFALIGRGAGKNGYLSFEDFCLLTPTNGVKYYHIDTLANAEKQAKTSFNEVYEILEENKKIMRKHFYWNKTVIKNLHTKSEWQFVTSGKRSKDSGRQGKIDFDEYHQYLDYDIVGTLLSGGGKKQHWRTTTITTDGYVRGGPLDDSKERAMRILEGKEDDNGMLPFICRLDDPEEVHNSDMWVKANPSLPYLPNLFKVMKDDYLLYKADPLSNQDFMTKRMNLPQSDKDVEVTEWKNLLAASRSIPEDLKGCIAGIGIDFASISDFATAGLLIKRDGYFYWICHSWALKNGKDMHRIHAPLAKWERMGLLTLVEGIEIPPELIGDWLLEQAQHYAISLAGIDFFRFSLIQRQLQRLGLTETKGQGRQIFFLRPNDRMRIAPQVISAFNNQRIIWGENNEIMRWYTYNSKIELIKGEIDFGKIEPKSRKTDGFFALVAAFNLAEHLADNTADSFEDFMIIS